MQVVGWGCGFVGSWRVPEEVAAIGYHSAQSPASVCVASPGYGLSNCKAKCSLCSVPQMWLGSDWVLAEGWAGGLWCVRLCGFLEVFSAGGAFRQS